MSLFLPPPFFGGSRLAPVVSATRSEILEGSENSLTVTMPSNSAGELVFIAEQSDTGGLLDLSGESFTTLVSDISTTLDYGVFYKFNPGASVSADLAIAAEESPTAMMTVQNVDAGQPFDVTTPSENTGNSSSATSPAITTVAPNSLVVVWLAVDDDEFTPTAPAGFSNLVTIATASATDAKGTIAMASKLLASPGTETPGAWGGTFDDHWAAGTFALRGALG